MAVLVWCPCKCFHRNNTFVAFVFRTYATQQTDSLIAPGFLGLLAQPLQVLYVFAGTCHRISDLHRPHGRLSVRATLAKFKHGHASVSGKYNATVSLRYNFIFPRTEIFISCILRTCPINEIIRVRYSLRSIEFQVKINKSCETMQTARRAKYTKSVKIMR